MLSHQVNIMTTYIEGGVGAFVQAASTLDGTFWEVLTCAVRWIMCSSEVMLP